MNKFSLSTLILVVALAACSDKQDEQQSSTTPQPKKPAAQASQPAAQASAPVVESNNFVSFDLNSIPVSSKALGAFPYFDAPDGYVYSTSKERPQLEKYFFTNNGKLIKVQGKYFVGYLEPKQNSADAATTVISSYEHAITSAGGVKLFEGNAPEALRSEYSHSAPSSYWKDMYNPLAASYLQYVINRGNDSIWVELAINPGTTRIDLTVIQQGGTSTGATASAPLATTASAAQ